MFCENCGNKMNEGDLFCSECGHKVLTKNVNTKNSKVFWIVIGSLFGCSFLIFILVILLFMLLFGINTLDEDNNGARYEIDNVKIENFERV